MKERNFGWEENVKSDPEMKSKTFGIQNVLSVFLDILHFIRDEEIDIRLNSLIENFEDFRKRKWKRIFQRTAVSESKREIEKKIREEKRQEKEMMRKGSRRHNKRDYGYDNYDYDDYGYDDYNQGEYYDERDYDDYDQKDEYYTKSETNFKKKKKYQEVEKKSKGKKGSKCSEKTLKMLKEFYKNKSFDEAKYKKVWDISEEPCDDIVEFLQEYLKIFMNQARDNELEMRKQVIYEWIEQEKMTIEDFVKGFNSGHNTSYQDFSEKPKYLPQLSNVLCHMVVNHELDLSQLIINKEVKGKLVDDEDDLEDLEYFYSSFFKELKKEIEKIEDEAIKNDNMEKFNGLEKTVNQLFA